MGGVNCYQTSIGLLTQNVPTSINTLVLDRDRRRSTHPKLNSVVLTFLPDKCCVFCCFRLSFTDPNASFALERHNDVVMIYLHEKLSVLGYAVPNRMFVKPPCWGALCIGV